MCEEDECEEGWAYLMAVTYEKCPICNGKSGILTEDLQPTICDKCKNTN